MLRSYSSEEIGDGWRFFLSWHLAGLARILWAWKAGCECPSPCCASTS